MTNKSSRVPARSPEEIEAGRMFGLLPDGTRLSLYLDKQRGSLTTWCTVCSDNGVRDDNEWRWGVYQHLMALVFVWLRNAQHKHGKRLRNDAHKSG